MSGNEATLEKLESMRLRGMARALRETMDTGGAEGLSADELVGHLVDAEWDERYRRKLIRLTTQARFRYRAAVEEIDFGLKRNLDKNELLRLCDCRWVRNHEDILVVGPTGVGKSFVVSALGHRACVQGYKVGYYSALKLFSHLKLCLVDGSYPKEIRRMQKQQVIIIDDFGLQPLDGQSRLSLLEILEDRHGRGSSVIVSQLPVAQWHEVIGEATVGDAICDRIVHGAHRIELKGESVRKIYADERGKEREEAPDEE